MDFINKFTANDKSDNTNPVATQDTTQKLDSNQSAGGLMDTFNNALGGGSKGEANEDALDKAVDWVQDEDDLV